MGVKTEQFPYKKLLFIGSFLQLALGLILYMFKSINILVIAFMGGASLLCLLLGALWHHKASRVIIRIFSWGLPALMCIPSLLLTIFLDNSNLVAYFGFSSDLLAARLFLLAVYVQTPLLIFIPSTAVLAHVQQSRIDIFVLRLYALLELILSVIFVIVIGTNNYQDLGIKNTYYNLFYIAICMLTALCSLAAFPIKTKWLNNLLNKPMSERKHQQSE